MYGQGFVTNGSAAFLNGNCYQITPDVGGQAGTVFSQNTINLNQPFTLEAVMHFGCKDANGADGIVFMFATSNMVVGGGGGFIGYQGITPSIAIEYDDYQNGGEGDPVDDHMAIISMGSVNHNASTNLVGPVTLPNIEDCADHCFSVSWNPTTQTFTGTLDSWTISYTGDIINNIFGGNPNVYFGFSSGTGSLSNLHTVCIGEPVLVPMADVTLCPGQSTVLQADLNGDTWTWAPHPTLSPLNVSNPTATPTQTTIYTVEIGYACGGTLYDTVVVTVVPMPSATASNNGPACPGESLSLMASGGMTYLWNGPLNFGSTNQNPVLSNVSPGMSGIYTVTVTDASGCTATATTVVLVHPEIQVAIDNVPSLCEDGDPVQLMATPAGGTWSGNVSSGGLFNPMSAGAGTHVVTYQVVDGNGCTGTAQVTVQVVANTPALITPDGPFCDSEQSVTLHATPAGGEWGEAADPNGQIHPATLGVGTHLVTYELSGPGGCFNTQFFIEIIPAPDAVILPIPPLCPDLPVQVLSATPPGGIWGGVANMIGEIDPSALPAGEHRVTYGFTGSGCTDTDTITITILPGAPQVANFAVLCDATGASYTVHFTISGGDPLSYFVTGTVNGSVTPGNPYVYASMPISSGSAYMFFIDDINGCDPVILSGAHSCACITNAGIMSPNLVTACEGEDIIVMPPVGSMLDSNDVLVYILHQGDPDSAIIVSDVNSFPFAPPLQSGVTYFVSAAVGNGLPGGGIDLMDTCLSVSFGTPVMWIPYPQGGISAPSMICSGDSASLTFLFENAGPYAIVWTDGTQWFSLDSVYSGQSATVSPQQTTTYTILVIIDYAHAACPTLTDTSVTISVVDVLMAQRSVRICPGDSVFAGGTFQHLPGIYIDTLLATAGCDSIVETTVMHHVLSSTTAQTTTCDIADAGVFTFIYPDINGCDSTVITTVLYVEADTTYLFPSTCDPAMTDTVINLYISQGGCDSVVIIAPVLLPGDSTYFVSTTCDSAEAGTSTLILPNQFGCDSVVITQVIFVPPDTTFTVGETCDSALAGVFLTLHTDISGCDSIVVTEISLAPSWLIETISGTCDALDTGVFVYQFVSADGCDSIVRETVILLPADLQTVITQTCEERDTGTMTMLFANQFGCDSLIVLQTILAPAEECRTVVREIFAPNVFSPNGDGVNDRFYLTGDPGSVEKIAFLRVFDRWGELIYELNNGQINHTDSGWDGTLKGKLLQPGVYIWYARIDFVDGVYEIHYGDVTIVR